jgi:hypothetical protein
VSLKSYSPIGQPVKVLFRNLDYIGHVLKTAGTFDRPVYLVDLADPPPFTTHVERIGISNPQKLREQMLRDGCLTSGHVQCLWVYWEDLELIPLEGSYTEYMEPDPVPRETCKGLMTAMKTWPGRLVAVEDAFVLELLDPIPVDAAPKQLDQDAKIADFIGEGSDLLAALPIDRSKADLTHGFRLMRPETAAYYAGFE